MANPYGGIYLDPWERRPLPGVPTVPGATPAPTGGAPVPQPPSFVRGTTPSAAPGMARASGLYGGIGLEPGETPPPPDDGGPKFAPLPSSGPIGPTGPWNPGPSAPSLPANPNPQPSQPWNPGGSTPVPSAPGGTQPGGPTPPQAPKPPSSGNQWQDYADQNGLKMHTLFGPNGEPYQTWMSDQDFTSAQTAEKERLADQQAAADAEKQARDFAQNLQLKNADLNQAAAEWKKAYDQAQLQYQDKSLAQQAALAAMQADLQRQAQAQTLSIERDRTDLQRRQQRGRRLPRVTYR